MERVCLPGKGLFPTPEEITLSRSCPDWADMCKHVAAVLYGVGARLDGPEPLFILRGVDHAELVAKAGEGLPAAKRPITSKRVMAGGDLGALFGVEMAETGGSKDASPKARAKKGQGKGKARAKAPAKAALAAPASVATRGLSQGRSHASGQAVAGDPRNSKASAQYRGQDKRSKPADEGSGAKAHKARSSCSQDFGGRRRH